MVNEWWADNPAERFWMEITDRPDLGSDLNAPQSNGVGKDSWTYDLVSRVQPGDIVLHWHKNWYSRSALVGWSEVVGPLEELDRSGLFELREQLSRRVGTTYYPFSPYRNEIRAAQAYLTKFPVGLFALLPELGNAMHQGGGAANERQQARRGSGLLQDPKLRRAIEEHAVRRATRHYEGLGATEIVVLGKPFDLLVRGLGQEIHVEVKGSALEVDKVILTRNEVVHARSFARTDLFVLDHIEYERDGDEYLTSGGRHRVWQSWSPSEEHLSAMQYQYMLQKEM